MRPRRDIVRVDMPASTADLIVSRVEPLLPQGARRYVNGSVLDAIIHAAYTQGAMDALTIADTHPDLLVSPAPAGISE